jgi:hypothetical protein
VNAAVAPYFDGDTYEPELDQGRLATLLNRVHQHMLDGEWHTLAELARTCGGTEASVSARLRDLRKDRFGGNDVRKRRSIEHDGLFEYRLANPHAIPEPLLSWEIGSEHHIVSFPRGFTVSGALVPNKTGELGLVFSAWDIRHKAEDPRAMAISLGAFTDQDEAKWAAERAFRKPHAPEDR